jgi:hypothetical protein
VDRARVRAGDEPAPVHDFPGNSVRISRNPIDQNVVFLDD